MLLPQKKVGVNKVNPRKLIIFSKPKTGKTSALAELEDNLIVDLEGGSDFVEALKINVPKLVEERNSASTDGKMITSLDIVKEIIKDLNTVKKQIGKNPYKRITLDTVTVLVDIVLPLAADMYRATSLGANWMGTDVRKLPMGAGYGYLNDAFFFVINQFEKLCDTLILVGHVRRKSIGIEDGEIDEKSLELVGKLSIYTSADADAIGYLYREDNKTILNFSPSDSVMAGARIPHLRDKQIVLSTCDENGVVTVNWDEIFIKE